MLSVLSSVNSQTDTLVYCHDNDIILRITDDYAEFRFGSVIGGGNIEKRNDTIIIYNDVNYTGQTRSYFTFIENDPVKTNNKILFQVKDTNNQDVSPKDFAITLIGKNFPTRLAQESDGYYWFYLDKITPDILIWVQTYMYFPLKINADNISPGIYHITLVPSSDWLLYMSSSAEEEIYCVRQSASTIFCKRKIRMTGKKYQIETYRLVLCEK
jgi:hypothetical protein